MSDGPPAQDRQPVDAKEKARLKEERRRLKEIELGMRNIAVGDKPKPPKMTKAERRALQEQQRAAKLAQQGRAPAGGAAPASRAASAAGGSGPAGPGGNSTRDDAAGGQHVMAGSGRGPRVNMDNRVTAEDKRMYLYVHLDLPQHPPTSAAALTHGQPPDTGHAATEHSAGDSSTLAAGIRNAAFPPGPQVVVGMARDDYAAAEAGEPATVKIAGSAGKPATHVLRDAMPPFAGGPGQRKFPKVTGSSAGIPVHPRIKEIGLRMATMELSGSNERTIAVMVAFKDVIADYTTPPHTTLPYHLQNHHLSPQINFLVHQRPMCIGMANAIRWLKSMILHTPHDLKEDEAKRQLISGIDEYIQERITAAGGIIAETGASKIQDGDVVLTYGASSTVLCVLLAARERGRRFRVIVVDARPGGEGQRIVRKLVNAGFSDQQTGSDDTVTYATITALSFLMRTASKVFLGAEAFFANGTMLSCAGTAMVALSAHTCHIPVIIACETYKFNERIQLDAVVNNELSVPDSLMYKTGVPDAEPVGPQSDPSLSAMEYSAYARDKYSPHPRWNNRNALKSESPADAAAATGAAASKKQKGAKTAAAASPESRARASMAKLCPLSDWRAHPRLRLLNLAQDITPPEFVSVIITEVGLISTTSIPVVLREYKNQI
ncbi:hypothetical protein GGF46_003634 [Coemansia sp. RSA 552]|nr:hypothetical protein GGF46_003634 [Coemansia sp. RSA 552]